MSKSSSSSKNPLTPTTIKIATLTGAAKDDVFALSEGMGTYELDVLANDPGSAKLYSVAQVSGLSKDQMPISNSATLSGGLTQFGTGGFEMGGGTVSILDGKLSYTNENAQMLRGGETLTQTFTYTVQMANGALSQATASFTITGENDLATITGDNSGSLEEDGTSDEVKGQLIVSDADYDESRFADLTKEELTGTYGSFELDVVTGVWIYTLDNDSSDVQALTSADTVFDELVVTSFDGTAFETIKVTIVGKDEPPIDSGAGGSTK